MRRRVEGDDADVIFEVLQKLVELFRAAVTVCKDLHLVDHPLRRPRLDVPQVDPPLLQEEKEQVEDDDGGVRGEGRGVEGVESVVSKDDKEGEEGQQESGGVAGLLRSEMLRRKARRSKVEAVTPLKEGKKKNWEAGLT